MDNEQDLRNYSESEESIPLSILKIEGATRLIMTMTQNNTQAEEDDDVVQVGTTAASGSSTRSALAMTILDSASTYQAGASDRRIGVGPSKNAKSKTTGLHQFKNIEKAKSIQAERKIKKAEARLIDSGIRVAATVWATEKNKLRQVRIEELVTAYILTFLIDWTNPCFKCL